MFDKSRFLTYSKMKHPIMKISATNHFYQILKEKIEKQYKINKRNGHSASFRFDKTKRRFRVAELYTFDFLLNGIRIGDIRAPIFLGYYNRLH